jgi:phosphate transport system substrate-binding protein
MATVAVSLLVFTACFLPARGPVPARQTSASPSPALSSPAAAGGLAGLGGRVVADGSSTVWPITVEVADRFAAVASNVDVEVGLSGTGAGFTRFCEGASDVQDASRPITEEERAACAKGGVEYQAFEIGLDGITVVVHPSNEFVECLTVDQLRRLWQLDDPARTWRDLDPTWPDQVIDLYGPGPASGTFDLFTTVIVGETGTTHADYTPSEDDHVLVEGVAADENALGYAGYAYFVQTQDRLKAVPIDIGAGCVAPSPATIADGSYRLLSRPLFIYVNQTSLDRPAAREFLRHYLATAKTAVETVGYVATTDEIYAANQAELEATIAGNQPADGPAVCASRRGMTEKPPIAARFRVDRAATEGRPI